MTNQSEKLTYTVDEVGQLLGIGRVKAYELANQDSFPKIRIGKRILIPKTALMVWMNTTSGIAK